MIKITFPDGTVKEYEYGITPFEIAQQISTRLANEIHFAFVNAMPWGLTEPIYYNCNLRLLK